MKKILYLFVAVFFFTACSNNDSIESIPSFTNDSQTSNRNIRSYEEALKIVQEAINSSNTRSSEDVRKIELIDRLAYVVENKTRATSDINDTLIYVFNFENNEGFALVSASKNTEGLLAITEEGHCNPNVSSDIEGFNIFIDLAKEYVANSIVTQDGVPSDEITKSTIVHSYSDVGPYVTVKWAQHLPEGELCPNMKSGCANTALAQLMTYYKYPSSIHLTYDGKDSIQNLNWNAMIAHNSTHEHFVNWSVCNNINAHSAISQLLRQLGELTQSKYNNSSTTTTFSNIKPAMESLGYTVNNSSNINFKHELNNHHIIVMRGGGHGWIVDGYRKDTPTEYIYKRVMRGEIETWVLISQQTLSPNYYNHINWGDHGTSNGYYLENVYGASGMVVSDDGDYYTGFDYGSALGAMSIFR